MSSNNASNNPTQQQPLSLQQKAHRSPLPTPQQFRTISRNNSNTSTSSSNKGEFSSTLSTTNSVTSSRSQLVSRAHQLMTTCSGTGACSTPIRSFQRATISSVVKTRAFDNNPVLKGLLTSASPSRQNSAANSQASSPLSTPVFSRSRSLRMSGGPRRYQQSPSHQFRETSRTPDVYSFTAGDTSMTLGSSINETQARLMELSSERSELKESLEFLECERQVLIDSAKELREILQRERSQWKREHDELKKQLTDTIAAKVRADSQLTKLDVHTNDIQTQFKKLSDELQNRSKQIEMLTKSLDLTQKENSEFRSLNEELKKMLDQKLRYNGLSSSSAQQVSENFQSSDCMSIITEMARLRLESNEKDKIISNFNQTSPNDNLNTNAISKLDIKDARDLDVLNRFLDETVECIKSWPEDLASSEHVQNLMKTLLSAYKPGQDELSSRFRNVHL